MVNTKKDHLAIQQTIEEGGAAKYHESNSAKGKKFVRDRLADLLDDGSITFEDGKFANNMAEGLPADGVVTGMGTIHGESVCFMANDSTVKAGSWGARTVEKIIRIQETAERLNTPMLYLVDSAGARITDQIDMFPGRRGAGRIFHNQIRLSGQIPQICLLFGPSAAGGAYIPAFCDFVIMVDQNASMYLGSPRMAEMVIGEKVSLEEMGGAKMHCSVSGCGDYLAQDEDEAIIAARQYMRYMPKNCHEKPATIDYTLPSEQDVQSLLPNNQNAPFDMRVMIKRIADEDSLFEVKERFAPELLTAFITIEGRVIGVVANQPKIKGGVLFHDSADKAARFMTICDAYNIPLLFLADVPGFMIGTHVERAGIIRHGAKMLSAMSSATVPRISVIVRKAYGAGLYAMSGPAFEPDCTLAFPEAQIAVMGPEAAVNAVYANKIAELPEEERQAFVQEKRKEYQEDIDVYRLASEMIIDEIIKPNELRNELIRRFKQYENKTVSQPNKKRSVTPV
ncbi:acyl-CoA carboxylase subunit beta [Geomicrobium sediminis]|uniref:Acetyl-CoA carboxylase carboxyltransferase component n=1 Tax=Geomicrobium sediminis TaxID=1347788 RepID=A0ABS2PFC8_9BACL|nr:acyl-CoA carboxylase subunit beta [Geomicrobium sediminis]MBM7633972.1 acetyl-CoA carboxylase carboxyltransferase component [Geomicrobium sediminis]